MIKFFRKIRQQLLTANKFSKYLLYAVGEIILVVVGILIALQINNWNQNKLTEAKEQMYLGGMKIEFEKSLSLLTREERINKSNIKAAKQIAKYIAIDSIPDDKKISKLISQSFAVTVDFNPQNSLLEEMLNSGTLKDISNNKLRELLTSWESEMKKIEEQEDLISHERQIAINRIREDGSIRTVFDLSNTSNDFLKIENGNNHFSNQDLLKSRQFESDVLLFIMTSTSLERGEYKPIRNKINQILKIIENEIKK